MKLAKIVLITALLMALVGCAAMHPRVSPEGYQLPKLILLHHCHGIQFTLFATLIDFQLTNEQNTAVESLGYKIISRKPEGTKIKFHPAEWHPCRKGSLWAFGAEDLAHDLEKILDRRIKVKIEEEGAITAIYILYALIALVTFSTL